MSKPSNSKILSLDSVLTFGKYRGFTVREILFQDIQYLDWLIEERKIELDNEAFETIQQAFR